jgi:hypothetical protein
VKKQQDALSCEFREGATTVGLGLKFDSSQWFLLARRRQSGMHVTADTGNGTCEWAGERDGFPVVFRRVLRVGVAHRGRRVLDATMQRIVIHVTGHLHDAVR